MKPARPIALIVFLTACVSLPEGTTLTLAPDAPTTTDDLVASLQGDTGDADKVTWTWSWQRDGELQSDLTGTEVPAARTAKGETWTVEAVATAGKKEGEPLTAEVSIENTAPVAASVTLAPTAPTTTQDVVATAAGSDADEDTLTWTYAWSVDGIAVSGEEGDTLPASAFAKGENIAVSATPNDGEVDGEPVTSAVITAVNSAPTTPGVAISPSGPKVLDDLLCEIVTPSTDADGDPITYTISWTADGVAWTGATDATFVEGDTILAEDTAEEQVWTCSAIASDGTDDSASGTSAAETVTGYDTMFPGLVAYPFEFEGYSVQCMAWDGDVCTQIQQRVSCDTCSTYVNCDVWHDTTPWNNGSNRTPLNFCAIATGDSEVASVGQGGTISAIAACGYSATHPICDASRASVHAAGFGIDETLGLLLDPSYCGTVTEFLHVECAGW